MYDATSPMFNPDETLRHVGENSLLVHSPEWEERKGQALLSGSLKDLKGTKMGVKYILGLHGMGVELYESYTTDFSSPQFVGYKVADRCEVMLVFSLGANATDQGNDDDNVSQTSQSIVGDPEAMLRIEKQLESVLWMCVKLKSYFRMRNLERQLRISDNKFGREPLNTVFMFMHDFVRYSDHWGNYQDQRVDSQYHLRTYGRMLGDDSIQDGVFNPDHGLGYNPSGKAERRD